MRFYITRSLSPLVIGLLKNLTLILFGYVGKVCWF